MAAVPNSNADDTKLFEELDAYPWESDTQFQHYLSRLLGPSPSQTQSSDLTVRAKCFYYARKKNTSIDFEAYNSHLASITPSSDPESPISPTKSTVLNTQPSTSLPEPLPHQPHSSPKSDSTELPQAASTSASASPEPPYPVPFASIVALITSGAPIPGIKEIPDTVLTAQATKPSASKRRKPWEKEEPPAGHEAEGEAERSVEGTFGDRRDEVIVQDYGEEPLGTTDAVA